MKEQLALPAFPDPVAPRKPPTSICFAEFAPDIFSGRGAIDLDLESE